MSVDYEELARIRKPIVVRMATNMNEHKFPGHTFQTPENFKLRGQFKYQSHPASFSVFYMDETTESRRVHGGPMVAGEYAFLVAHPTVFSSYLVRPEPASVIAVENGDVLSILGRVFQIQDGNRTEDPKLVRIVKETA